MAERKTKAERDGGGRFQLGVGGEYRPGRFDLDRYDARQRFFRILAQVQPEVLKDLRAVYEAVQDKPQSWHSPNIPDGLRDCGTRWHLAYDWCWDLARQLFGAWDAERKGEVPAISDKTHSFEANKSTHFLAALTVGHAQIRGGGGRAAG